MKIYKALILLLCINYLLGGISILGPTIVQQELESIGRGEIRYDLGNFGQIPYGKTLVGYIYIQKQEDGTNYWCDYNQTSSPQELIDKKQPKYLPIFLVDHSLECPYSVKAYNVQQRGGKIMLLASDSNILNPRYNINDQIGDKVEIPTIIIPKDVANVIKNYISKPTSQEKISISIDFVSVKQNGKLDMKLFFRSDEIKSLNFFKEFEYYKELLGDKLTFTPYYKYIIDHSEESSNSLSESATQPCIKNDHYCASKNALLRIQNPRVILLENIRQSCIYSAFGQKVYWNYMKTFTELCADANNPTFNKECSMNVLKSISLYDSLNLIEECMSNEVNKESKVEDDYRMYEEHKIFRVPELFINGIKYKGSWLAKVIFDSICTGFLDDSDICSASLAKEISNRTGFGTNLIICVSVIVCLITLILLFCYRRTIKRTLEDALNKTIQEQALKRISQYKSFTEKGGKSSDFKINSAYSGSMHKLELVGE